MAFFSEPGAGLWGEARRGWGFEGVGSSGKVERGEREGRGWVMIGRDGKYGSVYPILFLKGRLNLGRHGG